MAVPGCPLPTFCTASMARTRTVSTALSSSSVQSRRAGIVLTGSPSRSDRWSAVGAGDARVPPSPSLLIGGVRLDPEFRTRSGPFQHRGTHLHPRQQRTPLVVRRPVGSRGRGLGRRAASDAPGPRTSLAAYVGLTKPRVIELLLLTTVPVMFAAAGRRPAAGPRRRDRRRWRAVGRLGLGAQLRLRPRHRRADASHPAPGAAAPHRLARARRRSSASCWGSWPRSSCSSGSTRCRRVSPWPPRRSTCSSTRCGSSAGRPRTSSGAAWPAASRR